MAPARSYQDEKMDRNACDAVLIDSLRTDTGTGICRIDRAFGSDIGKRRAQRNTRTDFNCRADRNTHRHIGTTSEGRRYIRIRRAKTDVEAFIPLHPIAGQILELYNTTDDDRPVFPLPVRDVLWYEVHGMGVALGMKENLSYHMARHSFGTLTLTAGIPIESIARMMGHTNIDSTQVYAQVTDRKISSDMNRLMERRKPAAGKEAAG